MVCVKPLAALRAVTANLRELASTGWANFHRRFRAQEPVRHRPFYCGERSATICVVLGPKKSSTYSSEYASGFSGPVASHLAASPSPRHEGNVGQAP